MRKDIVEAFKDIRLPVLRWPGGCFADEYHWKDGIGEKASRKKMVNTNWGGVTEDNSFGTHEFFTFCELVGCEPYLAGNMGSGTVQELSEWIEYITLDGISPMADLRKANGRQKPWKLKYLGIGNENWGCGGNMRAEYYVDEYRRYQSFCKNHSGNQLYKVACGPSGGDYGWTDTIMKNLEPCHVNAISLHHYTIPTGDWNRKGSAREFDNDIYYDTISRTLSMDDVITGHSAIMHRYDPDNRIGLIVDEWGCWYNVEPGTNPGFLYQQNTMRDALVAAINLNIFNNHCDTVVMANLAQVVNVLQAVLLTEGSKLVRTPTYHVFEMYQGHQGAKQLESYVETVLTGEGENQVPNLHISASQGPEGVLVTAANLDDKRPAQLDCVLAGLGQLSQVEGRVLTGGCGAFNDFGAGEIVKPAALAAAKVEEGFQAVLPPCSVAAFTLR